MRLYSMAEDPVIVHANRTPIGKDGGVFADVRPEDLSRPLINEMLAEHGLEGEHVDDLMWGAANQSGNQGSNMARVIALLSDLGENVPATTINRWCASSAQAIISASDAIRAGQRDCIIAGGVEHMTSGGSGSDVHPELGEKYESPSLAMGITAEKVAEEFNISREEQDQYGAQSQQRACAATEEGRFEDEIVPINGHDEDGNEITVTEDEGLRPGTTVEVLSELPTVFKEDGTVTPGTASQVSDGAAAVMITSRTFAKDYGFDILAEVGNNAVAGVDPTIMGIGPVPACQKLFERSGTTADDYDLVELNEAFASQTVYCQQELGFDNDRFNVNGGAIAIGHPLGCSGARLPVTLIHEMRRRDAELGLATECVGFGQGAAIDFKVS